MDLVIKGGRVVDGTGTPARTADVGIQNGRIAAIGKISDPAARTIDADGLIVAPGFVDVHTHVDVQAFWDPLLSPSPLHGVTTVIGGNCGFSVAPLDSTAAPYLMRMLARVEGMPLASLEAAVPWDWQSTEEFLERYAALRPAINAGFMVGHSALRRVVMGEDAVTRQSTAVELAAMQELLRAGLQAGGFGFSSTRGQSHNDAEGRPVPSRHASDEEFIALASVCREFVGTSLELVPGGAVRFDPDVIDLMARMSVAAQRPLNWNMLQITTDNIDQVEARLAASDYAGELGGKVVALSLPLADDARINFDSGFLLDMITGWNDIFQLPADERLRLLQDPAARRRLVELAQDPNNPIVPRLNLNYWAGYLIAETFSSETKRYQGRLVGDIAAEEAKDPFDALLDIVVADRLQTRVCRMRKTETKADYEERVRRFRDPRVIVGASDAGAHLDMTGTFNYTTYLLGTYVREQGVLTTEEAVQMLTQAPAQLYGLSNRGVLAEGFAADIVAFDEATVGTHPLVTRHDLPTGAARLYAEAIGVPYVVVNGVPIVESGSFTGARPGAVLRSGQDTVTPSLSYPALTHS
jgi:N-acyl-D-aspartate/D-glutamate deacylase